MYQLHSTLKLLTISSSFVCHVQRLWLFLAKLILLLVFSVLAEDAIKAALADYRLKQNDKKEAASASN